MEATIEEKQYMLNEARMLLQKNKKCTDTDLIKQRIDERTARIEIGLITRLLVQGQFICLQWGLPHYEARASKPGKTEEIFKL